MTKINFRFSWVYNDLVKDSWLRIHKQPSAYPSDKKIKTALQTRLRAWKKVEKRVIQAIEKNTSVQFMDAITTCYVVGRSIPFSDPLTLPIFFKYPISRFVDSLTHELIHRIFSQPDGERLFRKIMKRLCQRYPKENWNTILHVVIHAVHAIVYRTI
ncbi:MAG: hypothetical protein AAB664_02805, partial [Patescibacteria group bacterium]